ncbi:hypothetical protein [Streptomyces sp. NBC_01187]|uniref:DUF7848 domain-containing protein n=1 Tax=Streptomyces sp. NBC_01187 TaxID=2903766 RepID=UPI00386D303B|nr:hypothetical protein OG220_21625 [Streptomyces sp. NBC_01187]
MMSATPTTPDPSAQRSSDARLARGTYRFRKYLIGPDQRPDADPVAFTMRCAACGVGGPTSEGSEDGTAWAVRHLKANPDHVDYREIITRPYRAEPGAWL